MKKSTGTNTLKYLYRDGDMHRINNAARILARIAFESGAATLKAAKALRVDRGTIPPLCEILFGTRVLREARWRDYEARRDVIEAELQRWRMLRSTRRAAGNLTKSIQDALERVSA